MAEGPSKLRDSERSKLLVTSGVVTGAGLKAGDILTLACWLGLAAGLLEVGVNVLRRHVPGNDGFYRMSRHFVWLIPLTYCLLFVVLGIGLTVLCRLWPVSGKRLTFRILGTLTLLPALMVGLPQIYPVAWLVVVFGIVEQSIPFISRHGRQSRRILRLGLPAMILLVLSLMSWSLLKETINSRRVSSLPMPPKESPNVLLIVLDTVGADHLSLHGYRRPTSPTLEQLASRGVRFDSACATASWTLPSHASFFTGRWPHETTARWNHPLGNEFTTIAECLSERGFETAAFVANLHFCGHDSGLARGFATYKDHRLTPLTGLASSWLGALPLDLARSARNWVLARGTAQAKETKVQPEPEKEQAPTGSASLEPNLLSNPSSGTVPGATSGLLGLIKNFRANRKDASIVNQEFLDWLSGRNEPDRPFFAFLNYWDAHHPYLVPGENARHFGLIPETAADRDTLTAPMDKQRLSERGARLLCDSYDDCIAFVDTHVGLLLEQLTRQGLLDRTIVIITSDHGESMGEHDLFGHGLTLYRPEIHVPLLILGTTRLPANRVVTDPVSLRDLPATILDLLRIKDSSLFPGVTLARYWKSTPSTHSPLPAGLPLAELDSPQPGDVQQSRSPAFEGPLASITTPDLTYIRGLRSGREEMYRWRADPLEARNLADSRDSKTTLSILRKELSDMVSPLFKLDPR